MAGTRAPPSGQQEALQGEVRKPGRGRTPTLWPSSPPGVVP